MKKLLSILVLSLLYGGSAYAKENNLVLKCIDENRSETIQLTFFLKEGIMTNGYRDFKIIKDEETYMLLRSYDSEYSIDRFTGEMAEFIINGKKRIPNSRTLWQCKKIERMF